MFNVKHLVPKRTKLRASEKLGKLASSAGKDIAAARLRLDVGVGVALDRVVDGEARVCHQSFHRCRRVEEEIQLDRRAVQVDDVADLVTDVETQQQDSIGAEDAPELAKDERKLVARDIHD